MLRIRLRFRNLSMLLVLLALTILCVYTTQDNLERVSLGVASPSINSPINGGSGARPTQRDLTWDEMFAACKHNMVNGLPCDESQISWMSEQWRRKEELNSIGVAWYIACIPKPAENDENANVVGPMMGSLYWVSFCAFNDPYLECADDLLRACSIVAQGDLDRASLAVESASIHSPDNGGADPPVRGLSILVELSQKSML
jgi:hypothetical protein